MNGTNQRIAYLIKKVGITNILLMAGIFLMLMLIFQINLFHYTTNLNADIGSEVALTKLIWESKEIIPQSWYPSSELRLISTPNISALLYGITHNTTLAIGLGCCFMTVGIVLSIFYFMSTVGIKFKNKLLMILLCLILPNSFTMLELLYLFAAYYATHVITFFLTLGFYYSIIKNHYNWFVFALLSVLALLLGIQGMRGMLITFGPLLAVELLRGIMVFRVNHRLNRKNVRILLSVIFFAIINYIGTRFPFSIGGEVRRNIRNGPRKLITEVLPDVYRALGFEAAGMPEKIIGGIFCLLSVAVCFRLIWKLWRQKTDNVLAIAYLMVMASPVLTIMAVSFSTIESTERYFLGFYFMIALSVVYIMENASRYTVAMVTGIIILLTVIHIQKIYLPVLFRDEPLRTDALEAVQYLVENDYCIAYASFDNAGVMTTLSNDKLLVAPVADVSQMDICKWLSSTEWYVPNRPFEEKTAYIITDSEKELFKLFIREKHLEGKITEEKRVGKYWIYGSRYNYSTL